MPPDPPTCVPDVPEVAIVSICTLVAPDAFRVKDDTKDAEVSASVSIGDNGEGGFMLAVGLEVTLPKVEREVAEQLVEKAHQVCPYSNATRGNVEVRPTVA